MSTSLSNDMAFLPTQWPRPLRELFIRRGLTPAAVQALFAWDLNIMPPAHALHDLEKGASRIVFALMQQEQIIVFGDYDVDGVSACSLLLNFFRLIGYEDQVQALHTSRFSDGYGLHPSVVDQAADLGAQLLITIDCGITAVEAAARARERGLDLIITDHHRDSAPELPAAYAVINPKRRDQDPSSDLTHLAGVGVAFLLAVQVRAKHPASATLPSLYSLLPLVALGTLCDLVDLMPLNLRLVRHGLRELKQTKLVGLLPFLQKQESLEGMTEEKVTFEIGPMINAMGRMQHPEPAVRLLTTQDFHEAKELYHQLDRTNQERKSVQHKIVEQAQAMVLAQMEQMPDLRVIVLFDRDWHEGVIGIVASKLVEQFNLPAVILAGAEEPGVAKGSARTCGELDLHQLLNQCGQDLFLRFGGHRAAAGLSIRQSDIALLRQRLNQYLAQIPLVLRSKSVTADCEVQFEELTPQLLNLLEQMRPFGNGNPQPLFLLKRVYLQSFQVLKDVHVKWTFTATRAGGAKLSGISFNYIGGYGRPTPEQIYAHQRTGQLAVAFHLSANYWRGNRYLQLLVREISLIA